MITENINAPIERLISPALKHRVFNVLNPIKVITAKFIKKDNIRSSILYYSKCPQ